MAVLRPGAVLEADGAIRTLTGGEPTEPEDALVIATSGTSGRPKAAIHTTASVEAAALATSEALAVDPAADRWLACLPLAHIGGLAVVMRSIVTETPVEVHDGFDAGAVLDAATRGATLVSLVTRALAQIPAEVFRLILIGGAAPPAHRPANVIATYGMTETGSGVVYDAGQGTGVLDGLELAIGRPPRSGVGTASGAPEPGREGEIHLRGPMLFRGYRGLPDPFTAGGWFPTGDVGSFDADGRLTVVGRRGDVIVTGGEKVWPEPVERVLAARPDIAQVAVVGRPDPDWGHRVVAVVVVQPGHRVPALGDLRDAVRQELPPWAAPTAIEVRDDLPRTSLGKVRRNLL